MANAADLVLAIKTDSKGLEQGLGKAKSSINNFSAGAKVAFAGIGVVLAGAFSGLKVAKTIGDIAVAIDDMATAAEKIGVTSQQFQFLTFAAEQNDTSIEALSASFSRMFRAVEEGSSGVGQQAEAFKKLGISASSLKNLAPEKQFIEIASAIRRISNINEKNDIGQSIFGRGFREIIPLVNKDISQLSETFEKLGVTLSDSQVEAAQGFDGASKKLATIYNGFKQQVASEVVPGLTLIVEGIESTIEEFGGVKIISLEAAQGIVGFASVTVDAFSRASAAIRVVIGQLQAVAALREKASESLGEKIFDRSAAGQETRRALVGVENGSTREFISPGNLKFEAATNDIGKAAADFLNGSKALDNLSASIASSLAAARAERNNLATPTNPVSGQSGTGEITGADGRTIRYNGGNTQVQQKVDVNVSLDKGIVAEIVTSDGTIKQFTRQQISEYMNSQARGYNN